MISASSAWRSGGGRSWRWGGRCSARCAEPNWTMGGRAWVSTGEGPGRLAQGCMQRHGMGICLSTPGLTSGACLPAWGSSGYRGRWDSHTAQAHHQEPVSAVGSQLLLAGWRGGCCGGPGPGSSLCPQLLAYCQTLAGRCRRWADVLAPPAYAVCALGEACAHNLLVACDSSRARPDINVLVCVHAAFLRRYVWGCTSSGVPSAEGDGRAPLPSACRGAEGRAETAARGAAAAGRRGPRRGGGRAPGCGRRAGAAGCRCGFRALMVWGTACVRAGSQAGGWAGRWGWTGSMGTGQCSALGVGGGDQQCRPPLHLSTQGQPAASLVISLVVTDSPACAIVAVRRRQTQATRPPSGPGAAARRASGSLSSASAALGATPVPPPTPQAPPPPPWRRGPPAMAPSRRSPR